MRFTSTTPNTRSQVLQRWVALLAIGALLVSTLPASALSTTRLSGKDRYATALAISRAYAPPTQAVFVATGHNFPDALAAAAAASHMGSPLLLTPRDALPREVADRIRELNPAQIFVVGGKGVVSESILGSLNALAPTTRLGGSTRYDTGMAVVQSAFQAADLAIVATGRSFPDALGATGVAGSQDAPVMLVDGREATVPASVVNTLRHLGVSEVAIAGGAGAVSVGIAQQLARAGFVVSRHGGVDRYATAAAVNEAFFSQSTKAFLATGRNFPDALAGAALAGRERAPLYLTETACMPEVTRASLAKLGADSYTVLGGSGVISDAASSGVLCLTVGSPTISGTPRVGQTLSVNTGQWTAGTRLTYQWRANNVPIAATGASLVLTAGHAGRRLSVTVTGSLAGYAPESVTTAQTAPVAAATRPADPGNSKNCSDFRTWREAQDWFELYYPYYGDVAKLDADGNRIACESLPGHP